MNQQLHSSPEMDEQQAMEWAATPDRKPLGVTLAFVGMAAIHDMPCAVHADRFAVYQGNTGVFHPSWQAQREGWRLVRATTWLQRLVLRLFFQSNHRQN